MILEFSLDFILSIHIFSSENENYIFIKKE